MQQKIFNYKTVGERQITMIFVPPTKSVYEKAPVYFIIPGGGWHTCSAEAMLGFAGGISNKVLGEEGWATVSINYRNSWEDGVSLDQVISDAMDAGRYLAHHADELGIDPHCIVTSGHSAGGHLALMMAYAPHTGFTCESPFDPREDDFTVVATAPMSPPIILWYDEGGFVPHAMQDTEDMFRPFAGDRLANIAAHHRATPSDYITPLSVPTLLLCGTHDDLIFPENCTRFYERCRALGAPCEIEYSHFGGHCFEPKVEGKEAYPNAVQIQDLLVEFVRRFAP